MLFITTTELEQINDSEYLHIYLDPKYSFTIKINGEEVDQNEIYIKAPTMIAKDVYDVRKVSSVISKFEDIRNQKLTKELARLTEEEKIRLFGTVKEAQEELESADKSDIDFTVLIKAHLEQVMKDSRSFELEKDSFFSEFDKISFFLESRLSRKMDNDLLPVNFTIFNKHLGLKQFIIEAVFLEYVGFFSKHFL